MVHWLFAESPGRRILFQQLAVAPNTFSIFRVREPLVGPGGFPGDVDVLISGRGSLDQSLAIECKRIRVDPPDFHTGLPGKLQELRKGVAQANGLFAMGFHRAFLVVIVVSDGRERTQFNFIGRGLTPELARIIDHFPARDKLHPSVGLAIVELNQPVDKDLRLAGGVGVRLMRPATQQAQPAPLTDRIRRLLDTIEPTQPGQGA